MATLDETVRQTLNMSTDCDAVFSYISSTIPSIDIFEPTNLKGEFVYNYFTPDERVSEVGNGLSLNLAHTAEEELAFEVNAQREPRYIKFTFTPTIPASDLGDPAVIEMASTINLGENSDLIMDEGAVSSWRNTGLTIRDTLSDIEFYNTVSSIVEGQSTAADLGSTPLRSGENLQALVDPMTDNNITTESTRLIPETMGNLQPMGVAYADTDTREIDNKTALTNITNLSFPMLCNNLFFSNLVDFACIDRTNVFEDEIRAYREGSVNFASERQSSAVARTSPSFIYPADLEVPLLAYMVQPSAQSEQEMLFPSFEEEIEDTWSNDSEDERTVYPVGYLLKKNEINESGASIPKASKFIEGLGASTLIDSSIRYGAVYVYTVKAVCLVKFNTKLHLDGSESNMQPAAAYCLVASKGTSLAVKCVENIPPRPPADIKCRYDYERDGLYLTWSFPINPQRDIKRFQVFRRETINDSFMLLAEYDFDNSVSRVKPIEYALTKDLYDMTKTAPSTLFRDREFGKDSSYIYALASVDARGFTSGYSVQLRATFDRYKNKVITEVISRSGAPKPYPNMFLNTDLFVDTMKSEGKSRLSIFFDPEVYKLTREVFHSYGVLGMPELGSDREIDQHFLNIGGENTPTYSLQIINTDLQQSQRIDISIDEDAFVSGGSIEIPVADLATPNIEYF